MEFHEAVKQVETAQAFDHKGILSHGLLFGKEEDWQIGYYNQQDDTVTVYFIHQQGVVRKPPEKPVQANNPPKQIEVDKVSVTVEQVFKTIQDCQQKHYAAHPKLRVMVLVQAKRNSSL